MVDSVGANTLRPARRETTGPDVAGIQLVQHPLAVFAAINLHLLISGKFLPRHLPCNDFRQLPHIVTFSQLSEAFFRSGLNFRLVAVQHIGLVLLDEANELPPGQVLASIQPLPVFLCHLISGAQLFGLVHKIQLLCTVCLFRLPSLDSRVNGFHRSGHRTADHAGHESDHEIIQSVR